MLKTPVIRNQFSLYKDSCPDCIGSHLKPKYGYRINDSGKRELVKLCDENFYNDIQAHYNECNLYHLIDRYTKGDLSALSSSSGQYVDTTVLPSSLREVFDFKNRFVNRFNSLSDDIKSLFDNNFDTYIKSIIDGSVNDILNQLNDSQSSTLDEKKGDLDE